MIGGAVELSLGFWELVEGRVALMGESVVWLAGPFTNGPYGYLGVAVLAAGLCRCRVGFRIRESGCGCR